jgi:hypothetical protein
MYVLQGDEKNTEALVILKLSKALVYATVYEMLKR